MTKNQESTTSHSRKKAGDIFLQLVLPLFLGILILWVLFRNTNFDKIWEIFKDANFWILGFSLLFGLAANTFRAARWRLLLKPLGHHPRLSNMAFAVYGGYAVNFAIPRAGELWRCGMITKTEDIPFTQTVSTMILDRVLDFVTVLFIIILAFILNAEFLISEVANSQAFIAGLGRLFSSVWLYAGILVITAGLFYLFKFHKNNIIIRKTVEIARGIRRDLKQIWKMKEKGKMIAYSLLIWIGYFFYFYITLFAFHFTQDLGFTAGLVTFTMGSISMAVPTNGGLGAWHAAVIASLMLYGVGHTQAEAFAFGVFALQSLWIIFLGLIGIVGLSVNGKRQKGKSLSGSH